MDYAITPRLTLLLVATALTTTATAVYVTRSHAPQSMPPAVAAPVAPLSLASQHGCLPHLATLTAQRDWQLELVRGYSGCMGDSVEGTYTVHADGAVEWERDGMPTRYLRLTSDELAEIRALDQLACTPDMEPGSLHSGWWRVRGNHIHMTQPVQFRTRSDLTRTVGAIIDLAITRHHAHTIEWAGVSGRFTARHEGRTYTLRLAGNQLEVARGREVVYYNTLADDQLSDLIDAARDATRAAISADSVIARGSLTIAGKDVPLALTWYEHSPLDLLGGSLLVAFDRGVGSTP